MIGSIDRLPNGKYRVRYYDGSRDERKRLRLQCSQVVGSRIEAESLRREIDAEVRRKRDLHRTVIAGRLLGLEAILTRWAESRRASGRIGPGRAWEVTNTLRSLILAQKWRTTASITADGLDRWKIRRLESGGSDNPLRYLLAVLRWAAGPPLSQPVDPGIFHVERQRRQARPQPALLTDEQVSACLTRAKDKGGPHVAAAYRHLATYGCRPNELCKILIGDFDPTAGTITYSKTKNGRRVTHPLLPDHIKAYAELAGERRSTDYLFTNPWGEPWYLGDRGQAAQLTGWWRDNVSMVLLPAPQRGIYCLKDYAISHMEILGIDDRTKALFTGHSTLAVFARYKATNQDRARMALDRLASRVT